MFFLVFGFVLRRRWWLKKGLAGIDMERFRDGFFWERGMGVGRCWGVDWLDGWLGGLLGGWSVR